MKKYLLLLACAATTVLAQGPGGPANREAPVTPVPFERILRSNQEPQNWLTYSGNLNSQRHSGLTQVSPENASNLTLKWVFQSRSLDKHEVTPLVVDGVMYTIQSPNDVIALDAATGKAIWQYAHKPAEGTRNPCCGNLTRGVAILGDKLFLAGLDAKMIALDAKTGKELWNVQVADYKQQYAMTVAPLVVKDKVISGVAGGEHGVRGFLAAFDVNTGKELWRFNTVPGPGEPGYETWLGRTANPMTLTYMAEPPSGLPVPMIPRRTSPCGALATPVPTITATTALATTSTAPPSSPSMPTPASSNGITSSLRTTNSIGMRPRFPFSPTSNSTVASAKL
jgi:alcohol dehydrogenase (cytochrome c)